ncbi:unnamed protein product [Prorocentrum cordatum]|uniref:Uncharacterized protein n=1 Tax=Prorocentrum cordatum TaxID=2364126 RepID=A0ABN9Q784_9DINO|nr:unnamed protein product [Polarella glacialis]
MCTNCLDWCSLFLTIMPKPPLVTNISRVHLDISVMASSVYSCSTLQDDEDEEAAAFDADKQGGLPADFEARPPGGDFEVVANRRARRKNRRDQAEPAGPAPAAAGRQAEDAAAAASRAGAEKPGGREAQDGLPLVTWMAVDLDTPDFDVDERLLGGRQAGQGSPICGPSFHPLGSAGARGANVEYLGALMQRAGGLKWPGVVAADWNVEPADLTSRGKKASAAPVRPRAPASGANEYGYAIMSEVLSSRFDTLPALSGGPTSPHSAAEAAFWGPHRRTPITSALRPGKFPADHEPPAEQAPLLLGAQDSRWQIGELPESCAEQASKFQRAMASDEPGQVEQAPLAQGWAAAPRATTSPARRLRAGFLAACRRAAALRGCLEDSSWRRCSKPEGQIRVARRFVIAADGWARDGQLAGLGVDAVARAAEWRLLRARRRLSLWFFQGSKIRPTILESHDGSAEELWPVVDAEVASALGERRGSAGLKRIQQGAGKAACELEESPAGPEKDCKQVAEVLRQGAEGADDDGQAEAARSAETGEAQATAVDDGQRLTNNAVLDEIRRRGQEIESRRRPWAVRTGPSWAAVLTFSRVGCQLRRRGGLADHLGGVQGAGPGVRDGPLHRTRVRDFEASRFEAQAQGVIRGRVRLGGLEASRSLAHRLPHASAGTGAGFELMDSTELWSRKGLEGPTVETSGQGPAWKDLGVPEEPVTPERRRWADDLDEEEDDWEWQCPSGFRLEPFTCSGDTVCSSCGKVQRNGSFAMRSSESGWTACEECVNLAWDQPVSSEVPPAASRAPPSGQPGLSSAASPGGLRLEVFEVRSIWAGSE